MPNIKGMTHVFVQMKQKFLMEYGSIIILFTLLIHEPRFHIAFPECFVSLIIFVSSV